ncbi:antibiotic biosynthesis monooxygenase [bacterium]|nr:antibiotic biosynthesis monooxygenase [bacterium]
MFMRIVQIKVNPDELPGFKALYDDKVIPALRGLPGCFIATLMKSDQQPDEYVSMTLWDSQENAEAYEQSGLFQKLLDELLPFLADSSEWKIHLSQDFTLEYQPQPEDPIVTSYPVVEQSAGNPAEMPQSEAMHLRIVSIKTKPGQADEFKKLYREIIIPALNDVRGCRYAYLTEGLQEPNQLFSVTIWESKKAAESYERSGLFEELTDKVQHTFSELFHWKMALQHDQGKRLVTTDDLRVSHYSVVTGKNFG